MVCLLGVKRGVSKGGMKNSHFHCLVGQGRGGGWWIWDFSLGLTHFCPPKLGGKLGGGKFFHPSGATLTFTSSLHFTSTQFYFPQSRVLLRFMWFNPYNGNQWVTSIKLHMDNKEQLLNAIIYYIIPTSKS